MEDLESALRSMDHESLVNLAKSVEAQLSLQSSKARSGGAAARSVASRMPTTEEIMSRLPKKKWTRDDVFTMNFKELKAKADLEASLPPERGPIIDRNHLLGTLSITQQALNESDRDTIIQVLVEWPQKYSSERLKDLSLINVSDLMIRKTHKGNYLLCRTIARPVFDGGIGFLLGVEDPNGNTAYVKVLNYALLFDADLVEINTIIRAGAILALREPSYYTNVTLPDLPFIKVESPSDIVIIESDNPMLNGISWKSELPLLSRISRATNGQAWKAEGLKDFKASRWFSSAVCFTNSIKFGFDVEVSRLNRAEVYLRLGWNNSALHDAQVALDSGSLSDELQRKAIVRKIKALYAMGRYQEVLEIASTLENDKLFAEWVTKANRRVEEQSTGIYDWLKLYKEDDKKESFSPDIADFTGPVEVKKNANGLRGTYVTRDVKTGELLMFHKPTFSSFHSKATTANDLGLMWTSVPTLKSAADRHMHRLFCKGVQRVWDDRHMYDTIRSLYAGETLEEPRTYPVPFAVSPPLEHPTRPSVDIDVEYLQGVTVLNAFGVQDGQALYAAPSLMNNSCMPSALRQFIGDAIIVRTIQDLEKGEEVTLSYLEAQVPYDEKQFRLMKSWRFDCECGVCKADDEDGYDARETRRALSKKIDEIGERIDKARDPVTSKHLATEAKKIIDDMKRTFHEEHSKKADGCKYELAKPLRYLANALGFAGRLASDKTLIEESIEVKMQSLAVSGLKITDSTLSGAPPKGKLPLPVDTRQVTQFYVEGNVATVLEISYYFLVLGDKKRAKRWFDTAVWMESVYSGGGLEVLKVRQAPSLGSMDLSDLY
ncbi:hypothetical protein SCHPADRAFT_945254 [Schizopora paradoxa]|uniref:SET domain-containing protein n=1 Tax=Schizopora paradoxa TaxID=27342 RepID=A0A0H2R7X3_9AGAM|nr:hypothetical protein SCHPADRAFT_945254 [Schizopora paradoxa]